MTLLDLKKLLARGCAGKIVYFGSRLTLKLGEDELTDFTMGA